MKRTLLILLLAAAGCSTGPTAPEPAEAPLAAQAVIAGRELNDAAICKRWKFYRKAGYVACIRWLPPAPRR